MILQCKDGVLYKYSRDSTTKVSSYSNEGINIKCSLQPLSTNDGLDGGTMYNTSKLYSDYMGIDVGDKISILGRVFVVKQIQKRNGLKRKYIKALVNESIGD